MTIPSLRYRLAPEHPYPAPLNDCETATKYFMNNADKYNVDPHRIGVSGKTLNYCNKYNRENITLCVNRLGLTITTWLFIMFLNST